jgi:phosphoglycerate dehydrogenase-like enzyme
MPKIIITQNLDLYPDQIERIKKLGNTTIYTNLAKSPEEWLERCQGANIICTGKFGLKTKIYELSNVFISLPFVAIGWIDLVKLKERNINVANSPGCNKDAVSEWIIAMMINIMRDLIHYTNVTNLSSQEIPRTPGLTNKKVVILGKGNIGSRVGKICETCNMKVEYFL